MSRIERPIERSTVERSSRLTPLAASASALAMLACCLPTCLAAIAATAGISVMVGAAQPWLLGLSVASLGVGLYEWYRARGMCLTRSRTSVVLLWVSAAIVTFVVADWLQ